MQNKIIDVICTGSPLEMGRQYGEQARNEIRWNAEEETKTLPPEQLAVFAATALPTLEKFAPDVLEEMRGMAQAANVELSRILRINHVDTFDGESRCTPVILRHSDAGLIVAKNDDAPPHEAYRFVIRKIVPSRGIPAFSITRAGWLSGLDMMNAAGLANTHGSVGSVFPRPGMRLDIRLYLYMLMQQCETIDSLMEKLEQIPLTGKGFSIGCGDRNGECVFIDAAVPLLTVRSRNRVFDYSTNLYQAPGLEHADRRFPAKRHICQYRQGYLRWIEETRPPQTLADLQALLRSHEPWAPCRHGGAHQSVTNWSLINLPQQGKLLLADGPPCQNHYKEYSF